MPKRRASWKFIIRFFRVDMLWISQNSVDKVLGMAAPLLELRVTLAGGVCMLRDRFMQLLSFVAFLGCMLFAGSVRAQPTPAHGVRLSFVRTEAASGCIAPLALEREVARRMGYSPFEGEARQWIEGTIDAQAGIFDVQLFERDAEGNTLGTRHFREQASDCHKLDDAIELAIALIIDPSAQLAPSVPVPPQAAQQGSPTAPANVLPRPAPPRYVLRMNPGPGVGYGENPFGRAVIAPNKSENRLGTAMIAADAVAFHGVLPGVAWGVELLSRLSLDARERVLLRASALLLPQKLANEQGKLGYSLSALEVGGCMQERARHWALFGCGGFGIGSVHVVVYNPDPRHPDDRLWTAFRIEGGATFRIAGPVWLDARLFDLVPLKRWDFQVIDVKDGVERPVSAYKQSWFMPGAALGIGLHFN